MLVFFENADVSWVKTTDLNNGVILKTEEKISQIALAETSVKILPKGTVFVAMYGGFNQIGRTGRLETEATCNQALSAIYPNDKVVPYYLLTYLNLNVDAWKDLAASSRKDPNITKSDVLAFPFLYPSIKEQTKIGEHFQKLDSLINQHQQKHDKLSNIKKALLEKMFPRKNDELGIMNAELGMMNEKHNSSISTHHSSLNVPEIRFEGFSGEWEEKLLGEVTNVYDGTHQTPKYTSSGVMFLSVENIKTLKSEKFISKNSFEKEFKIFPKKNDVLMTRIGDVGTANVVESDAPKAYYVTLTLLQYKKLDPYFLKNSIESSKVRKDIWHRTLHIAFPKKINMNEIAKVMIPKPTEESEQTKIGNLFKQLDTLITQHQTQLKKLGNIKCCFWKVSILHKPPMKKHERRHWIIDKRLQNVSQTMYGKEQ